MQQAKPIALHGRYLLRPNFEPERGHYQYSIYAQGKGHKMLDCDPAGNQEKALSNAQRLVSLLEKARHL
ncbi:MAG: hypothetical protein DWQ07_08005 [Chloroflexi bacterium]|nr:MAG: hypothetical protein DWQ07_08005 [Chloroflexota bacterium]MBL1197018.1 hypothetical protein [Chloroflexota bacterium]NOH14313.1 hypothetical protein [Chloroflexota bacterium]